MENSVETYYLIDKEEIPNLKFSQEDVLTDPQARKRRNHDLSRATMLGNGYHGKVQIFFQTADGENKRLDTTIWHNDNEHVIFKSGSTIPLRAILGIEFY